MGWVDNLDDLHSVRTVGVDLGAAPSIGIFTDMRDASGGGESNFSQQVDNLRIVYEDDTDPYPEDPVRFPRQVENLDRGIVAVRRSSSQVYVGWRLLGNEDPNTQFIVYRSANGGSPIRLHLNPITTSTNFVDSTANTSLENTYFVRAIVDGVEQDSLGSFTLAASSPVQQHIDIPIQKPAGGVTPAGEAFHYDAVSGGSQGLTDASVGDLDGDGQYEVIVKWEPSNKSDNQFGEGFTGNTYLDAYTMEGQMLWRIDLGINIRSGQQYTPFLVYDFDGDGRSEVVLKTADGTVDGLGTVIGDSQADWREPVGATLEGQVVTGPEFLTVFDGLTGAALVTVDFPLERQTLNSWGDDFGNRSERYMAAVAYLDGERPSIVWTRGIYGPSSQPQSPTARNEQVAFDWRDGQLTQRWRFNAVTGGANNDFVGEGAQSLSVADVDGDGFDEIIYGAAVVDHDGTLLYATGLGHGDALHVSDLVPSNPGLEIFMPHEDATGNGGVGASLRDAMTGQLIVTIPGSGDVGRGLAADIDPNSPGYEIWATSNETIYSSEDGSQLGPIVNQHRNRLYNFAIWWDGDLSRELLNEDSIWKWNTSSGAENVILEAWQDGAAQSVEGKWTPALQADIFGDWREEVIWRNETNTELQIWTTTDSASNRIHTLMHDTQYREAIAWQNVGYNQPPHPSFFLGAGMDDPPQPLIYFAGQLEGDFDGDDDVDGADFLQWQRGFPNQYDQNDLADWQSNYGSTSSPVIAASSNPEPALAGVSTESSTIAVLAADSDVVDAALTVALADDESLTSDEEAHEEYIVPVVRGLAIPRRDDFGVDSQDGQSSDESSVTEGTNLRSHRFGNLLDNVFEDWQLA